MNGATMDLATARLRAILLDSCGAPTLAHAPGRDSQAAVHRYAVVQRELAEGPVVLVLTGGDDDAVATAAAGEWAACSRTAVVVVPAIAKTRFSINALLHHAHNRRIDAQCTQLVERATAILPATVPWSVADRVKLSGRRRVPPMLAGGAVASLLDRHAPAALISVVVVQRSAADRLRAHPAATAGLPRR